MTEITQEQVDIFKSIYPDDAQVQNLSVEFLQQKIAETGFDWKTVTWEEIHGTSDFGGTDVQITLSDCQMRIGYVILDTLLLALGATSLRANVSPSTIQSLYIAAAPVVSEIEQFIAVIGRAGSQPVAKAMAVFGILKVIWTGGCLPAVFKAFTGSLTYWQMALYGVTGLATIVAAFATDGLAFAARVVLLLSSFGFLVADAISAVTACNIQVGETNSAEAPAVMAINQLQDNEFPGWTQVPNSGTVSYITVLADDTFLGIGTDNLLYTKPDLNGPWVLIPNSGTPTSVSECGGVYIATGTDTRLYFNLELGTPWSLVPNGGTSLCATFMPDGSILAVGTDKLLYTRPNLNDDWRTLPGDGQVTSVAIMPDGTIAGVGPDKQVWVRGLDEDTSWKVIPGSGSILSLTAWQSRGYLVGVGTDGLLYIAPLG